MFDVQQVRYWKFTNIRWHHIKFSRRNELALGIYAPLFYKIVISLNISYR